MNRGGSNARAAFALMILCLLLGTLLAYTWRGQNRPFDIGDFSAVSPESARAQYAQSGTNEDLVYLLKTLSYRYVLQEEEALGPEIRALGQELFDRARAGTADLEALDDEEGTLLQVLSVVRQLGAK